MTHRSSTDAVRNTALNADTKQLKSARLGLNVDVAQISVAQISADPDAAGLPAGHTLRRDGSKRGSPQCHDPSSLRCLEFGSDMMLVSRLGQLGQGESIASTATGLHESGHA